VRKETTQSNGLSPDGYDLDLVVATYWEPVLHWIRSTRRVRGGEAEEVRQEVFLRVTREIRGGMRYRLPIGAAIFRITNWTVRGYVARAAGRREHEQPVGEMPAAEPVDHGALREIDTVGQDEVVEALFARLGDREGTLMTMHYLEGLELSEVAEMMGITGNNAHQIHHRAKKRISEWLVEDGA
jgi:RNA polymerase sigma factor (sigma-70 family)